MTGHGGDCDPGSLFVSETKQCREGFPTHCLKLDRRDSKSDPPLIGGKLIKAAGS